MVEIEIKPNGEIHATITRKRDHIKGQSALSPVPFRNGERLSGIFPHEGPKGNWHEGNLIVEEIIDNENGCKAIAKCPNRPCTVKVVVYGV